MAGIAIAMPRLGMTMEEGTVVEWPVPLGAPVEKGATVLVIETEKAETEVVASASGFFRHAYVAPGETVSCGTLLGALSERDDEPFDPQAFAAAYTSPDGRPAAKAAPKPGAARAQVAETGATPSDRRRPVAPAARALAKKLGIELDRVEGSGPGGRVTKRDVEAWAAAREQLVGVDEGVALEVFREGAGDHPVVLLPGFGTDVSSFALQTPALAERHAVVGVNPRGVGLSDAPDLDVYEVSRAAEDVATLLDTPAHVVGASLGAAVALELALSHPERVRTLTLITPFVEVTARLRAVAEAWCRTSEEAGAETLAHSLAPWLFGESLLADEAARELILRGLAQTLGRVPAATLRRSAAGMLAWSGSRGDALASVRVPSLVLVAGADLLTPGAEALAATMPTATCVVVPGAGHALTVDGAQRVTQALLDHLEA